MKPLCLELLCNALLNKRKPLCLELFPPLSQAIAPTLADVQNPHSSSSATAFGRKKAKLSQRSSARRTFSSKMLLNEARNRPRGGFTPSNEQRIDDITSSRAEHRMEALTVSLNPHLSTRCAGTRAYFRALVAHIERQRN